MKTITLFFVWLALALTPVCAKIGDTETEIKLSESDKKLTEAAIDKRAKVVVFTGTTTQHAVGILDGKVEVEVFTNNDDTMLSGELVRREMEQYCGMWYPVACDESCVAAVSDDFQFFAKYGASPQLKKQNVLTIFSDTWEQYAKPKRHNITL